MLFLAKNINVRSVKYAYQKLGFVMEQWTVVATIVPTKVSIAVSRHIHQDRSPIELIIDFSMDLFRFVRHLFDRENIMFMLDGCLILDTYFIDVY
jgi:hypothetical protein